MKFKYLAFIFLFFCNDLYSQNIEQVFIGGCGNDFIAKINYKDADIIWSKQVASPEECNDIKIYREGLLYAYRQGARMIDQNGDIIWDYKVPEHSELYTARKNKKSYIIATCSPEGPMIVHVDDHGKEKRRVKININDIPTHDQIRQLETINKNHYLVPIMGRGEVAIVDKRGNILKKIFVGGTPFSVCRSARKNIWWIACGDAAKIVALDIKKWKIVKEITNLDLKGSEIEMLFVAEIKELKNGNLMVSNWNGHSGNKNVPKLFIISPIGEVISSLPHNNQIKNISTFDLVF